MLNAFVITLLATSSLSHPHAPRANALMQLESRMAAQHHSIINGMKDGRLTIRESRTLRRNERRIERRLKRYLRDGRLRPWELRRMTKDLNRQSRLIRKYKKNRYVRYVMRWRRTGTRRPVIVERPIRPVVKVQNRAPRTLYL